MKSLLLPFAALLLFSGCYTDKKAERQVLKALDQKPQIIAKIARNAFPCITVKSDTSYTTVDSTFLLDCPEITPASDYFSTDTVRLPGTIRTRIIRVPVTIPIRTGLVVQGIEDSAKIKLLTYDKQQLKTANDQLEAKLSDRSKCIWWLVIFALALSTPWIIKAAKFFA